MSYTWHFFSNANENDDILMTAATIIEQQKPFIPQLIVNNIAKPRYEII